MLSIAPSCRTDGGLGVFIGSPQTKCIYVVSSVDGEQERMIKVAGGVVCSTDRGMVVVEGECYSLLVSERSEEAPNNIYYDFIKRAW